MTGVQQARPRATNADTNKKDARFVTPGKPAKQDLHCDKQASQPGWCHQTPPSTPKHPRQPPGRNKRNRARTPLALPNQSLPSPDVLPSITEHHPSPIHASPIHASPLTPHPSPVSAPPWRGKRPTTARRWQAMPARPRLPRKSLLPPMPKNRQRKLSSGRREPRAMPKSEVRKENLD